MLLHLITCYYILLHVITWTRVVVVSPECVPTGFSSCLIDHLITCYYILLHVITWTRVAVVSPECGPTGVSFSTSNGWEKNYSDKSDDFNSIETCGKKGILPGGRRDNVDELVTLISSVHAVRKNLFSFHGSQRNLFPPFPLSFLRLVAKSLSPVFEIDIGCFRLFQTLQALPSPTKGIESLEQNQMFKPQYFQNWML